MTDVSSVGATSATTTTSKTAAATSSSGSAISSDFETFLKMLTVQLENQDPLNPIESSDYAVQLATFSSVEQQVQTNDLLTALVGQGGTTGIAQFASWVGMSVLSPGSASFNGTPVDLTFDALAEGETGSIVVRNSSGAVVERLPMSAGEDDMKWNGLDASGQPRASGAYDFQMEIYENGVVVDKRDVRSYSQVVEVRSDIDGAKLILAGGDSVAPSDVSALRE
ncbi:flagellar basal-body rod modification protein FlgD [Poseidonocella pacifica]|uniref:Basal-body rod modification protein FlgD n=1 Tax=Poseidonocella pacifica TaxID=871651 RepID=A0A1I0XY08_9RHOB|nr:flagellar hook capping FlgD N-terminal domain-containing protein [Poseidonocella pacifica]SFB05567.1 flagellar basal-body rod modification protein FlgD [Poseidonocella pacifica]